MAELYHPSTSTNPVPVVYKHQSQYQSSTGGSTSIRIIPVPIQYQYPYYTRTNPVPVSILYQYQWAVPVPGAEQEGSWSSPHFPEGPIQSLTQLQRIIELTTNADKDGDISEMKMLDAGPISDGPLAGI